MKAFEARYLANVKFSVISIILLQLTACSNRPSAYTHWDDAAPTQHIDIAKVDDATPKPVTPSRYGNPASYVVNGQRYYVMPSSDNYVERGIASWYGTKFHGKRTSSGEPYNMYAMTAAHKSLPLPTYVRVRNLHNGRSIVVKVNDRGPFIKNRIIDLSFVAAKKLGITGEGTGYVEVSAIQPETTIKPEPVITKKTPVQHDATQTVIHHTSNLYLQVGIFNDRHNAESLRTNLEQLPLPTIRVTTDTSSQIARYRVRIGPLNTEAEADQLIDMLTREGHTGFRIRVD